MAYLNPGLHPDGHDTSDSGWPDDLLPYAKDAWRRYDQDEFTEEELYSSDAQWAGLFDRMHTHTEYDTARRRRIAEIMEG